MVFLLPTLPRSSSMLHPPNITHSLSLSLNLENKTKTNKQKNWTWQGFPLIPALSLALTVFTPLLLHSSLIPERRGLMETSHLGLGVPKRKSKIFFIKNRNLFPHSSGGCGAKMKAPAGSGTGEGYLPPPEEMDAVFPQQVEQQASHMLWKTSPRKI